MQLSELIIVFLSNIKLYFVILLLLSLMAFLVIRKLHITIFDPFFLTIISCAFAYTVPFFLYNTGNCSDKHLWYFVISETFFWFFFFIYRKSSNFISGQLSKEKEYSRLLFYVCLLVFLGTSIYTYTYIGIPLFMESRLELFSETPPGMGILLRLVGFASFYVVFYAYHMMFTSKKIKYLVIIVIVGLDQFLSGSKGGIWILFIIFFIYYYFYLGRIPKVKPLYLLVVLPFPLIVISMRAVSGEASLEGAVTELLSRFMAFGDCYSYAYPNDVIDSVKISHPFNSFFKSLLAPFRLVDTNYTDNAIGLQLFWDVNPAFEGKNLGPNARLAIMGWCYFGWMGILFSAFCGWLLSFIIYRSRKYFLNSFLGIFSFGYIYNMSFSIITDFSLFLGNVATFIINIIVYASIILILSDFKLKYIRNKFANQ